MKSSTTKSSTTKSSITNPSHHPLDTRLLDYAAGRIDAGDRLVVGAHLAMCSRCRATLSALEHVGGVLLSDLPPEPMAVESFDAVVHRLDQPAPLASTGTPNDMPELPASLRHRRLGPWRWRGPGVQHRALFNEDQSASRVFLLRAAPRTRLPEHTHTGTELTLVLKGSFAHAGGTFRCGDFEDADGEIEHRPVVGPESECICLVAMDGQLKLSGVIGRLVQPFVRL